MSGVDFDRNNLVPNLENTFYFVEADHFSMHALWVMTVGRPHPQNAIVKWGEINVGFFETYKDTTIGFWFAYIYDKLVCFYAPTSKLINWDHVEEFLEPYIKTDKNGRRKQTNPMNFHHCSSTCDNE